MKDSTRACSGGRDGYKRYLQLCLLIGFRTLRSKYTEHDQLVRWDIKYMRGKA